MKEQHQKKMAVWIAVGSMMTLVVVLWALLLPMQLRGGTLIGARDSSRWNVYRPQVEEAKKSWKETMDQLQAAFSQPGGTDAGLQTGSHVSESDIQKLKTKIEAAGSRNESMPKPKP